MHNVVSLAMMALASAAGAECPPPEASQTGLRLTYDDGPVEIYRTINDQLVTVEGQDFGEVTHRMELLRGVYLQRYVEERDGAEVSETAVSYSYPDGEAGPPAPLVEATWSGEVMIEAAGGTTTEPQLHEVGIPFELVIGDCTLVALPITITYGVEADYIEIVNYLPDYEIGYLSAYQNAGRDLNEFTITLIEALP